MLYALDSLQTPAGAAVSPLPPCIKVKLYPTNVTRTAYVSARAWILQEDPSFNLLFFQNGLDALALVGTEGDAGFSWASTFFHLFLLVFLLHFNLEVMHKKTCSQHWFCLPEWKPVLVTNRYHSAINSDSVWVKINLLFSNSAQSLWMKCYQ